MQNPMNAAEYGNTGPEPQFASPSSYHLPQPGARPNVFEGVELAMAMSFTPGLPYWYEVNIYRKASDGFVVAIRKFFSSEDETDFVKSWSFASLDQALNHIQLYDASNDVPVPNVNDVSGSPAQIAAEALALKSEVAAARAHFSGLVGELFAELARAGADV